MHNRVWVSAERYWCGGCENCVVVQGPAQCGEWENPSIERSRCSISHRALQNVETALNIQGGSVGTWGKRERDLSLVGGASWQQPLAPPLLCACAIDISLVLSIYLNALYFQVVNVIVTHKK